MLNLDCSVRALGIGLALVVGVLALPATAHADGCRNNGGGYYQGYNDRPFIQNYAPHPGAYGGYYNQPPVQVVNNYGYGGGGGYGRQNNWHGRGGQRHWNRGNQGYYVPYRRPTVNVNVGW